jgi:methyl-accepting chemotaxis protein
MLGAAAAGRPAERCSGRACLGGLGRTADAFLDAAEASRLAGIEAGQEAARQAARAEAAVRQAEEAGRKAESSRSQGLLSAARTLESAVELIQNASGRLAEEASEVTRGAQTQKGLVDEAATAMEEMNATVLEVSRNAADSAGRADQARTKAQAGAEIVEQAIGSIGEVHRHTGGLRQVMGSLGNQAESIGEVMGVIGDIADQTNLLALNAAIEAARAGDAGRGFAVVADEVRKLAEKTMTATKEVGQAIAAIQQGARRTTADMEEAARMVDEATRYARASGTALGEIVAIVGATSDGVRAIATAAEQQAAASEEISRTISEVSRITDQTGAGMQRSSQASEALARQIDSLATLNRVFRIIGNGTPQKLLEELGRAPEIRSMQRDVQERHLRRVVDANPFLELAYMTDGTGRQIIGNVAPSGLRSASGSTGSSGYGQDWSTRPWFTGPVTTRELYISDSYVSQASGQPCITVAKPLEDEAGRIVAVLALDVKLT